MPVRNAEATLAAALDSIVSQSFSGWELIAANDGSTDSTAELLAAFADRDSRIKIFHRPHEKIISALNFAAEQASGNFFARMDADDESLPERFELQLKFLQDHPAIDVVSCRVATHPDSEKSEGFEKYLEWVNGRLDHEAMARERFIESAIPHPSVMLHREAFEMIGGYRDRGWPEDYDLWLRMFNAGMRFGKVDKVLLHWRDEPTRASRSLAMYSLEAFLRCKLYHLLEGPLKNVPEFYLWGAGKYGKAAFKILQEINRLPKAILEIDPRKIGTRLPNNKNGVPIISFQDLPQHTKDQTVITAVGSRADDTPRNQIRSELINKQFREGKSFWMLA